MTAEKHSGAKAVLMPKGNLRKTRVNPHRKKKEVDDEILVRSLHYRWLGEV